MSDILQDIQELQFSNKEKAEELLLSFLSNTYPYPVLTVELRPSPVSLNSFNGVLTQTDGQRFFFKTHTEHDTVIEEYYHAELLAQAGYPIIQPVFQSIEKGKQLLIYQMIDSPSIFQLAWDIDNGDDTYFSQLKAAQNQADKDLYQLYLSSLEWCQAQTNAEAPIHQLFYHRIEHGRLERFYGFNPSISTYTDNKLVNLQKDSIAIETLFNLKWHINGQVYEQTFLDIINEAREILNPNQVGYSIIGHGDAHNGNVFMIGAVPEVLYFDPAFAGKHSPLLDLVKPLFHNVFAMWMYYPSEITSQITIDYAMSDHTISIEYDFKLKKVRDMFWNSKVQHTLIPILQELKMKDGLPDNWRNYLKKALFCCPFLTMNLLDGARFDPKIRLLGLAMSIEMGAESFGEKSYIDHVLDEIEKTL